MTDSSYRTTGDTPSRALQERVWGQCFLPFSANYWAGGIGLV